MNARHLAFVISITLCATACHAQSTVRASSIDAWGFAAPWDARSDATIRAHGERLGAVVTGWIGLDSVTGRPLLPSAFADTVRPRRGNSRMMAIVTSWHGERFHRTPILALARNPGDLARAAGTIARHAQAMRYSGLVFDFEMLEPGDLEAQLKVMRAIADSARARGVRTIATAIPATDTLAYPARRLLTVADFIIPMLYDEHWSTSGPGPVASPAWVRRVLAMRVREAGASRVVAGLPTYGYRWITGKPTEALASHDRQACLSCATPPRGRCAREPPGGSCGCRTPRSCANLSTSRATSACTGLRCGAWGAKTLRSGPGSPRLSDSARREAASASQTRAGSVGL
jgi:hypothetical protein